MATTAIIITYKRKNSEDLPIEKKRQILEKEIKFFISFLKFGKPLFMTFNDNTWCLNLTYVNISNNNIDLLPRKLGALHCLHRLDVSHNCLKWQYGWGWLKEARIKRTLGFLDISNNSLPLLSHYIWDLTALEELNISHNFLRHIPQGIEKVLKLKTLDVSHNLLKYLPVDIMMIELQTIDISMNPLVTSDIEEEREEIVFPTLTQFAANALYQYCKDVDVSFQWDAINDIDEIISKNIIDICLFCGEFCSIPYYYGARANSILSLAANVISHTEISTIWHEYYYCYHECGLRLRVLNYYRNT